MMGLGNTVRAAAGVAVLLMAALPSSAEVEQKQPAKQVVKQKPVAKQPVKQKQAAKAAAPAPAPAPATAPVAEEKPHHLVLQVNVNDPAMMNLALNNATNVAQYYKARGEKVAIDIVTFGPGLHMLRDDTSPVKARIKAISENTPSISFEACGNTRENMAKSEGMEVPLISEAKVVESGVVRIMQRQEQGWTYVRP